MRLLVEIDPDLQPLIAANGCLRLLSEINIRLAELLAAELATEEPLGATITVLLGGSELAEKWDSPDGVGFHAVASGEKFDPVTDDSYFEIADRHLAVINLDNHLSELLEGWDPGYHGRLQDLVDGLVTLPHEVYHCIEWIKATGNRSPLEVFDAAEPNGFPAIRAVLKRIDGETHDTEDQAEAFGSAFLSRASAHINITPLLEAFDEASISPRPG